MKAKMIEAGAVLLVILGLCWYAAATVHADTGALRSLAVRAGAAAENADFARAEALIGELQRRIDERRGHLEVLALHEDLNQVSSAAAEARVRARYGQREELAVSIARMMEALTLLDERQRLTWSNLF